MGLASKQAPGTIKGRKMKNGKRGIAL